MKEIEFLTFESSKTWVFPELEDFIYWLEDFDPDALISENWTTRWCPIWRFLKHHGWMDPTVYGHGFWHPEPQTTIVEEFRMPSWACEFSWWEDKLVERSLTAIQCIKLINNPVFDPKKWDNGKSRPSLGRVIGF